MCWGIAEFLCWRQSETYLVSMFCPVSWLLSWSSLRVSWLGDLCILSRVSSVCPPFPKTFSLAALTSSISSVCFFFCVCLFCAASVRVFSSAPFPSLSFFSILEHVVWFSPTRIPNGLSSFWFLPSSPLHCHCLRHRRSEICWTEVACVPLSVLASAVWPRLSPSVAGAWSCVSWLRCEPFHLTVSDSSSGISIFSALPVTFSGFLQPLKHPVCETTSACTQFCAFCESNVSTRFFLCSLVSGLSLSVFSRLLPVSFSFAFSICVFLLAQVPNVFRATCSILVFFSLWESFSCEPCRAQNVPFSAWAFFPVFFSLSSWRCVLASLLAFFPFLPPLLVLFLLVQLLILSLPLPPLLPPLLPLPLPLLLVHLLRELALTHHPSHHLRRPSHRLRDHRETHVHPRRNRGRRGPCHHDHCDLRPRGHLDGRRHCSELILQFWFQNGPLVWREEPVCLCASWVGCASGSWVPWEFCLWAARRPSGSFDQVATRPFCGGGGLSALIFALLLSWSVNGCLPLRFGKIHIDRGLGPISSQPPPLPNAKQLRAKPRPLFDRAWPELSFKFRPHHISCWVVETENIWQGQHVNDNTCLNCFLLVPPVCTCPNRLEATRFSLRTCQANSPKFVECTEQSESPPQLPHCKVCFFQTVVVQKFLADVNKTVPPKI